ncbi:phosphoribosylformylglycinamidine cyclo-ligase [Botrimarina hoheduenensis]|nr:phosphoribosylformylglycinamidine cyclo-ligase [Botrimarina hoheduenensis]
MPPIQYKDAGVDLDIYEQSMARLPSLMRRTHTPRVMPLEGGFAGLFRLDFAGKLFARQYRDPVLVSCTDGVGTKLKVAQRANRHDTVGRDLVAMCVNDALCTGAEPLFFLDYIAMGRDDPDRLEQVVRGISDGCIDGESALIGGETAIMPDLYGPDDYDLAGFSVGVVERDRLIDGSRIGAGDVILGLASSGLHSNGYSLVRKIVFDAAGLGLEDTVAECDGSTVADLLMVPTRIYVQPVRAVLRHYRKKQVVHGIAHITGGGLVENLSRILPAGVMLDIDPGSWPVPPVFGWLQRLGEVPAEEMARVFNRGVGMALVVSEHFAESIARQLIETGVETWPIGRILARHDGP